MLDRLGRCLKLFVSTESTSCHEFASQVGVELRRSRSSRLGSRKEDFKSKDNVVISDMFLYLIMLDLLKGNYVLHAIQL